MGIFFDTIKEVFSDSKSSVQNLSEQNVSEKQFEKSNRLDDDTVKVNLYELSLKLSWDSGYKGILNNCFDDEIYRLYQKRQEEKHNLSNAVYQAKLNEKENQRASQELYEKVIFENGYGLTSTPYIQLAKIYHKDLRFDDEIIILEKGILRLSENENSDLAEKLYPRLEKAIIAREKQKLEARKNKKNVAK